MEWPKNIKTLTEDELKAWLRDVDEKPFRASQIQKWLFCQQVKTYDEMGNISPALRQKLADQAVMSNAPMMLFKSTCSRRKMKARRMVMTTLSLSMGATLDTSPNWMALK